MGFCEVQASKPLWRWGLYVTVHSYVQCSTRMMFEAVHT